VLRLVRSVRPTPRLEGEDELRPLADAAAAGNVVAQQTLLTVLGPHLLRVVRRVLGGAHPDVEDVTQECAVELVPALRRFQGQCSVHHFSSRVALHVALAARRRLLARKRTPAQRVQLSEAENLPSLESGPDARAAARSRATLVRQLCEELPEPQAEVLGLHYVLGHTMSEIAAMCEIPLETARSRLRLAKKALLARASGHPELREFSEDTA